jgi:Rad3-related DNA helicase
MRNYMKKTLLESFHPNEKPREIQTIALNKLDELLNSPTYAKKEVFFLELPTGFGKSLLADAIIRYYGEGYVCTQTKQLQEQYQKIGFKTCKGRANFDCKINGMTCDVGECKKVSRYDCPHKAKEGEVKVIDIDSNGNEITNFAFIANGNTYVWLSGDHCNYWQQKADAINASHVVFNYKYMLGEMNFSKQFGKRAVIVADEGHNLDSEIASFFELEFSRKQLDFIYKLSNLSIPKLFKVSQKDPMTQEMVESWISYLTLIINRRDVLLQNLLLAYEGKIANLISPNPSLLRFIDEIEDMPLNKREERSVKDSEYFESVMNRIEMILKYYKEDPENWLVDESGDYSSRVVFGVKFKPVFISEMARNVFFKHCDYCFIISATLHDELLSCRLLGLDREIVLYARKNPVFPIENSPIFDLEVVKLNKDTLKMKDTVTRLVDSIDAICDLYPESKGMIHTATYDMSEMLRNCRNADRFIIHDRKNREQMLQEHLRKENTNTVLVSPSMTEGVDLPDDQCRFQIIPKVQYKSMADGVIRKRMEKIEGYLDKLAAISLAQSKGRGTRSETDYCDTYLLDTNFERLIKNNTELFQKSVIPYKKETKDLIAKHGKNLKEIVSKYPRNLEWTR